MKSSIILSSLSLLVMATACNKREMTTYNAGHFIQFTKALNDTTNFSFFFHPGKSEVAVPLPVRLIGPMPEGNLRYELKIDSKASNIDPKLYALNPYFEFRKGLQTDTAWVVFKNAPELATKEFKLAIEVTATNGVKPGQTVYARRIFKISDMVTQPEWWDWKMEAFYLGTYTEKKYRKFMEFTGEGDLSKFSLAEQTDMIKRFKYYLIQMKDNGTPVLEEDGTDMLSTIPIAG